MTATVMRAMVLEAARRPLRALTVAAPEPAANEVLIRVEACGVCRTDLHIVAGELDQPSLPLIPGHEIVGRVIGRGSAVTTFDEGARVGVGWLGHTCGACAYCAGGRENLCDHPQFTGYSRHGGFAEFVVADAAYCFRLPDAGDPATLAPLMCAGLIGYRSYRLAGDAVARLGIYGFGAAAHLIAQIAAYEGKEIYAFTRPGDVQGQAFARAHGAGWAGDADTPPPVPLDAAIIFAPVGALVPRALAAVAKGGTVVCGGIHMSEIPAFPYAQLWGERVLRSVANLTRADGDGLLAAAARAGVRPQVERFPLAAANEALARLEAGELSGAAVLVL